MHETPNPKPLEGASAPKICPKCQDLIDRRVCGMCAECWYGAQPKRDAQAPAATPGEVEATICYGCGTCGKEKIEPPAISCCPERKIVTVQEAAQRAANDSLKVRDMVATWIFDALAALPDSPAPQAPGAAPIPMILYCPHCHYQHIDEGQWATQARPHRKHVCASCGFTFKPAMVATVGVREIPHHAPKGDLPPGAAPGAGDLEELAEAVHDAYLETCASLGWSVKPENQVPYSALTEDSKELDRASVRAVLAHLRSTPQKAGRMEAIGRLADSLPHSQEADKAVAKLISRFESGKSSPIEPQQAAPSSLPQGADMRIALENLLATYIRLAESGDAGNWDYEKEAEVIAARAALAAPTQKEGDPTP